MGSGPPLLPGASTRLQTILDNHRPASPTNAPAAQFFGPHVACQRGQHHWVSFLIAGAPMLREQSGKSRALQVWKEGSLVGAAAFLGREGWAQRVVPRARRDSSRPHLCLGGWGRPHTFSPCVQATSAPIQISHFGTHPQLMCSMLYCILQTKGASYAD